MPYDTEKLRNITITGNSLTVLREIKNSVFDLVITSPPYFQQRDYGNGSNGIGNEDTESQYIQNLLEVFTECVRTTKEDGAIVFNLGDKYINGSLSLLPYKFAIGAIETGVFLINQLTWSKLNPTPRQEQRKLIQSTEPFFIFAKSKYYHFDLQEYLSHLDGLNKIGSKQTTAKLGMKYYTLIDKSGLTESQKNHAQTELQQAITAVKKGEIDSFRMKINGVHKLAYGGQDGGRNNQIKNQGFTIIKILGNKLKRDIIESPVEATKGNLHPAVYPRYIIQEMIKLLTKKGDFILDPFLGSGTTSVVSKILERDYLGIEINPDYVKLAEERITNTNMTPELFL